MKFGRDEWILAFVLGLCGLVWLALEILKHLKWQDSF